MTQQSHLDPQPFGYPPPLSAPSRPRLSPPATGWVLLAAGVVAVVGSVTPWVSVRIPDLGSRSVTGIDGGDGVITLVCGLALLVTGLVIGLGQGRLWTPIVALSAAGVIGLITLIDVSNLTSSFRGTSSLFGADLSIGFGLWLVAAGSWLAVVMSIVALSVRRIR